MPDADDVTFADEEMRLAELNSSADQLRRSRHDEERIAILLELRPLMRVGIPKTPQPFECRLDDVVRIRCSDRLRQHVRNPGCLHHRADSAAGDDSRTFNGRLQQDSSGAKQSEDLVRNRIVRQRDRDHVLLGCFNGLADGLGHFLRFAAADIPHGRLRHRRRRER